MKVSVFNNTMDVFDDEILGRPFSFNKDRCEFIENYEEADYILGWLDFRYCEEDYNKIANTDVFKKYAKKFVFMSMHDSPTFAYREKDSIKFIAQPLRSKKENQEFNIISYPLQMRHFELEISRDKEFLEELRTTPKEYDFVFIGNSNIPARFFLKSLRLDRYYTRPAVSIWNIKTTNQRIPILKEFYRDMAKCKYAFAPRGIGSSSFRLYQSLMSGTIPIVFDVLDYPFEGEVNWDSFAVRGLQKTHNFNTLNLNNYDEVRQNGIDFWDNWVDMEVSDRRLYDILKSNIIINKNT